MRVRIFPGMQMTESIMEIERWLAEDVPIIRTLVLPILKKSTLTILELQEKLSKLEFELELEELRKFLCMLAWEDGLIESIIRLRSRQTGELLAKEYYDLSDVPNIMPDESEETIVHLEDLVFLWRSITEPND